MRNLNRALVAATLLAAPAQAATFTDGFEGETAGPTIVQYAGFANWTVSNGQVDLINSSEPFRPACRTGTYCVDMDGSQDDAGRLTLASPIDFVAGDSVEALFWMSGSQVGLTSDDLVFRLIATAPIDVLGFTVIEAGIEQSPFDFPGFNAFNAFDTLAFDTPFQLYGFRFTAGTAGSVRLQIEETGGNSFGLILDDVTISVTPPTAVVPEPGTWALLIAGFGLVGLAARRRRARPA